MEHLHKRGLVNICKYMSPAFPSPRFTCITISMFLVTPQCANIPDIKIVMVPSAKRLHSNTLRIVSNSLFSYSHNGDNHCKMKKSTLGTFLKKCLRLMKTRQLNSESGFPLVAYQKYYNHCFKYTVTNDLQRRIKLN